MTALATLDDLTVRLGRALTAAEMSQATAWLDDATAIITDRFPQYLVTPTPASTAVCCSMVRRVLLNPGGLRSEAVDDYSYTRDNALSAGELYMTDSEIDTLRPVRTNAFSIVPIMPPDPPCP
jgi:hypothetical protein